MGEENFAIKSSRKNTVNNSQYLFLEEMQLLFILSYIPRPSFTASTMVAKLSSVSVMSAAAFATSVQLFP